ncbi:MAG: Ectoine dioxygenase [Alphaproteobacteria bacterium MarineAlpha4_Bin2]|nr:MAG: Ectoine dioxygenase [Alphaproteobacteria bacterium MarineAlpha4_Bin2]
MPLSEAEIEHYHNDGYVIPEYRLSEDTLQDIRADHDRLLKRHPEYRDYCPMLLRYDLSFLNYARDPNILDMVEQVIGPDIILWNSSFFAKPAVNGKKTPWHQDGEYWPLRPLATCTVWLAVDDATVENGCLKFMPGSHKVKELRPHRTNNDPNFTLHQELLESEYDDEKSVALELEAGQMSLHDVYLLHGSEANDSGKPRRGMTMRFMPGTSVFDREKAKQLTRDLGVVDHSDRTIYLMRGEDQTGENDFQVRL